MKKFLALNLVLLSAAIWLVVGDGLAESIETRAATANPGIKTATGTSANPLGVTYSTTAVINYAELDIFYDISQWNHSNSKKAGDTMPQFIYQLKGANTLSTTEPTSYKTTSITSNYQTMADINGDGLVDAIYRDDSGSWIYGGDYYSVKMAVWLNKGNNNFQLAYKCYVGASVGWYGDCAAQ